MKTKIILSLLLILIFSSCSSSMPVRTSDPTIKIPELKEYYESLMDEGRKWSPDAYMYLVEIPIGWKTWTLSAAFYSPSKNDESLQVLLEPDGQLTNQRFRQERGVLQQDPILSSQWQIGSQDALNILMNENIDTIQTYTEVCGSLILGRGSTLPDRPLLWILYYHDCRSPLDMYHSYLDPKSGIIISTGIQ